MELLTRIIEGIFNRLGITKNRWPKYLLEKAIMRMYKQRMGYCFDLDHPVTFTEKVQWYKSRYHRPDLLKCVDKYLFKSLIAEKLGSPDYVIPLFGVWEGVNDFRLSWNKLPEKFCLKSTLQSDGNYIKIIEKSKTNLDDLCNEIKEWFKPKNLLINSFCSAYHKAVPRIIAEEYMESISNQLYDYKIFCFNGNPYCIYAAVEHFQKENYPITFYSLDWEKMDVKYGNHLNTAIPEPKHLKQMVEIAKKLSVGFPFIRVDFFDTPNKLFVAELTFYPGGGFTQYHPTSFNKVLGDMFQLP